ncbi:hypothetical protein Pcinc_010940 [Petrolisthes cinctipes]|uniref:Uncharacterized protein n=1 Tax=Petrolisthes cinctipes TaxID=88211 RepID=A0AAE1KUY2_PETCI|nr:hypothetical protein Pcinc_010940 [Petrolisthes cinctipes]
MTNGPQHGRLSDFCDVMVPGSIVFWQLSVCVRQDEGVGGGCCLCGCGCGGGPASWGAPRHKGEFYLHTYIRHIG